MDQWYSQNPYLEVFSVGLIEKIIFLVFRDMNCANVLCW